MSEQTKNDFGPFFMMGIVLAIGIVVAFYLIAESIRDFKRADQYIYVKGYAEKQITSDNAQWSFAIKASGYSLNEAYNTMENYSKRVEQFLESKGIAKSALSSNPIYTMKNFKYDSRGYQTSEIESFSLEKTYIVTSNDVNKINELSKDIMELVRDGIEVYSYSPQYYFSALESMKIDMLAMAAEDAKNRAFQLAKSSGSEVGALKSASQGVFQITGLNSTDVSDYGINDMSSIEKKIKAVVTIQYYVK